MPFTTDTFDQTRDKYLQAVRNNGKPDAPIGPDSDNYVRACAYAAVMEGVYAHQAWIFRQAFDDLCDDDVMERRANQLGLFRKPAALAGGTVRLSGTAGALVAAGQQMLTTQGVRYQTTALATIGAAGTVDVACIAMLAGLAGNQANNTPVTVDAPPGGVLANATLLTMTSGADVETYEALRTRLMFRRANPPQGGSKADYQLWALAVPGVARALVYPIRRGRGTVDVVPMPATGLPSPALVAAVQAYIDSVRPVGLGATGFQALAPTAVATNITATLTYAPGSSPVGVRAAVTAAIDALFATLVPGSTLVYSQLIAAIIATPGVADVLVNVPSGNVTCVDNESNLQVLTKGVVTYL